MLVEPFGPQMRIGRGVDQPGGDAYLLAGLLDASIQHIAHAELAADPPGVDRPVGVGQRGVARDHEHAIEPREIGRQIFGNAIDKIKMFLWIVADIGERQHDDRQSARRRLAAVGNCLNGECGLASSHFTGATKR